MLLLLILLVLILLRPVSSLATNNEEPIGANLAFYLSPNGFDENIGTIPSEPWKTFQHALSSLNPGDTLILLDGIYTPSTTGMMSVNCSPVGNADNGTEQARITVQAENERQAFIQSDGSSAPVLLEQCAYWNIVGVAARNNDLSKEMGGSKGDVFSVQHSHHIELKRNLAYWPNRYFNAHAFSIAYSDYVLVEESEAYAYHRHAYSVFASHHITLRRNYANSRGQSDLPDGYISDRPGGDETYVLYGSSDSIVENSIAEFETRGFEVHGGLVYDGRPGGYNNQILGSIHMAGQSSNHFGAQTDTRMGYRTHYVVRPAFNNLFKDFLILNASSSAFHLRSSVATRLENVTILNTMESSAVSATEKSKEYYEDKIPICGKRLDNPIFDRMDKSIFAGKTFDCSFDMVNTLIVNNDGPGVIIDSKWDWIVAYSNVFNNHPDFSVDEEIADGEGHIRHTLSVPPIGLETPVYIASASNMKGAGQDGADIGANILYRYQDGVLTDIPLWNPQTGAFPCGALVANINDIPRASCYDAHTRLNVNPSTLPYGPEDLEPTILTRLAVEDTWVNSKEPAENYGNKLRLHVDAMPNKTAFLKFDLRDLDVTGGDILTATLQLTVDTRLLSPSSDGQRLRLVTEDWNESTVTYNNAPPLGDIVVELVGGEGGEIIEVDVTSVIQEHVGKIISFALDTTESDRLEIQSRESDNPPIIEIIQIQR